MKRILAILLLLAILTVPALAESELVYRTEDVELHMPGSWAEKILILPTPTGASFYQKASYDKYLEEEGIPGGGFLFTLGGCVNSDFENLPHFIYLGFCEDSAMNYYLELPTDYPAYMENEIRAEWDSMYNMIRGVAQGAVIRDFAMTPEGKMYTGTDPWGNPLAITIDNIDDDAMDWTYTEDFEGQVLTQSFEDTELIDGEATFHIDAAIEDADYITCDYSGTLTVEDDAITVTFEAGEMTEDSSEGGSTAYHVEALEESERTVVLTSGTAEDIEAAPAKVFTSGDYEYTLYEDAATIVAYNGSEQALEIPSEIDGYPVTEIGPMVFSDMDLTSVTIPEGVLLIGEQAFEYCAIPDALQLPENITIGKNAFSYAKLPETVTIPAGAIVEECAFSYCKGMQQVVIESGARIKGRGFGYCDHLQQVVCAADSYLEKKAFEYCKGLKQAVLQGEMEEDAFSNCADFEISNDVVEDGNGLS